MLVGTGALLNVCSHRRACFNALAIVHQFFTWAPLKFQPLVPLQNFPLVCGFVFALVQYFTCGHLLLVHLYTCTCAHLLVHLCTCACLALWHLHIKKNHLCTGRWSAALSNTGHSAHLLLQLQCLSLVQWSAVYCVHLHLDIKKYHLCTGRWSGAYWPQCAAASATHAASLNPHSAGLQCSATGRKSQEFKIFETFGLFKEGLIK